MDAPGRSGAQPLDRPVISDVPARPDRLPWSRFHWLVVVALGITWILDGLEVTIAGAVAGALQQSPTDLVINGSFWIGAALGAAGSLVVLDPDILGADLGWRIAFGIGAVLGLIILYLRRFVPESPRWLLIHGRAGEANCVVADIEARVVAEQGPLPSPDRSIAVRFRSHTPIVVMLRTILVDYRQRALLGFVLMVTQAFLYNAIFFTYALILGTFYGLPGERVGLYIFPFALGNFLGPLLLGRLFDTVGRRRMIASTYGASGALLAITAILFERGLLDATSQTVCWSVIFFFASAAASAAYLTVSEIFPLEVRAFAIALFFMLGTATGGIVAPWLFATLIETGEPAAIAWGYHLAAVLMLGGALTAWLIGVDAERKSLEAVATPLSSAASPEPGS